ncbi:MAG: 23S rRNA (guanosine(2251)-2'-O)-methyltransferase RlmB [Bacteroidota bacterium]
MAKRNLTYGLHPVIEALEAGQSIEKIFVRKDSTHGRLQELRRLASQAGVQVQYVPDAKIKRLAGEGNHQGVVAMMSAITYADLEPIVLDLQEKEVVPLFVMLDGVTDVRNFGAIVRTAECMGAHAVIVSAHGSAAANADAVKVSAGALHHLPICRVHNLVDSLMLLSAYGIASLGCTEKAGETIFEQNLSGPLCIVMGSEDNGISKSMLKRIDTLAKIPMTGNVSSLNVSVAAGMAIAEAVRQRSVE